MKGLSPIEKMVDAACGYQEEKLSVDEKAERIRNEVIGHIDLMYPGMWEGVPKTARISLRNLIEQQVKLYLGDDR